MTGTRLSKRPVNRVRADDQSRGVQTFRREDLARLGRGAALALLLIGLGSGLGYFLHIALARWMGTSGFGAYAYATTWATVLSFVTSLGLHTAVVRFIPLYRAEDDPARLAGMIRTGRRLTLLASLGFSALGTAFVVALGAERLPAGLTPTILGLWLIPSLALVEFDAGVARAHGRVAIAYLPWWIIRPVATLVILSILYYAKGSLSASLALAVTLAIFVAVTALMKWMVDRSLDPSISSAQPQLETRIWLGVGFPLLLAGVFQIALTQSDILIVGALGGKTAAALYTAASKTALLVGYLLIALGFVAAPLLAPLAAAGNRNELQRLVSIAARWVFWPSLVAAGGLALLSPFVLRLFGADFAPARVPMIILIGGQVINAAFGAVAYVLSFTGHQKDMAKVTGMVAGANVALCFLGMHFFGMKGAAAATVMSALIWNVWLYRLTIRRIGVDTSIFFAHRRASVRADSVLDLGGPAT
jgi:O-antigen/teichoic acid export membrane protein